MVQLAEAEAEASAVAEDKAAARAAGLRSKELAAQAAAAMEALTKKRWTELQNFQEKSMTRAHRTFRRTAKGHVLAERQVKREMDTATKGLDEVSTAMPLTESDDDSSSPCHAA